MQFKQKHFEWDKCKLLDWINLKNEEDIFEMD